MSKTAKQPFAAGERRPSRSAPAPSCSNCHVPISLCHCSKSCCSSCQLPGASCQCTGTKSSKSCTKCSELQCIVDKLQKAQQKLEAGTKSAKSCAKCGELQGMVDKLQQEKENVEGAHASKMRQLETQLREAKQEMQKLNREKLDLKQQLEERESVLTTATRLQEEQLQERDSTIRKLKEQLAQQQSALQQRTREDSRLDRVQKELDAATAQNERLQAELEREIARWQKQQKQDNQELGQRDSVIKALREQVSQQEKQIAQNEKLLRFQSAQEDCRQNLMGELEQSRAAVKELQEKLLSQQEADSALLADRERADESEAALRQLRSEYSALMLEKEAFQKQVQELLSQTDDGPRLREDNQRLTAMLIDARNQCEATQGAGKEVDMLREKVDLLTQEKQQLLKEVQHIEHLKKMFTTVNQQTNSMQEAANQILAVREQKEQLKRRSMLDSGHELHEKQATNSLKARAGPRMGLPQRPRSGQRRGSSYLP